MSNLPAADMLGLDELSQVLGFLSWKELLKSRVCSKWREAVKVTLVPPSMSRKISWMENPDYFIVNREYALALNWVVDALPRIQTIHTGFFLKGTTTFMVEKGDAPIESYVYHPENRESPWIDFRVLTRLRDLRSLSLEGLSFNGSYDYLFNFPKLEVLNITYTGHLRWDLSMVAQLPKLKKLHATENSELTGNLESLKVIGSTLEEIVLSKCQKVEGSIKSLAKFPRLKKLSLTKTKIIGDIREIGKDDFEALSEVDLPSGVYGGEVIKKIEDAPDIMQVWYRLNKRNPGLSGYPRWNLSEDSPQHYAADGHPPRDPPFEIEFVRAETRLGWRWTNCMAHGSCETNWFDPEPDPTDPRYDAYLIHFERLAKDVSFYEGFHSPPTQMQYEELNDTIPPPLIPNRNNFASLMHDYVSDDDNMPDLIDRD
ncbi:unnamed protein product [Cylindrotheca closterium]|uniref:F-box domain-containing protein n=1 Tax=Cylindrotheca closterium TaxID=2856 RepID=A0AAD2CN96_9STRA|nr:unnamed protein product [Cylindrotheca closterium]